jgi:hypothetical protein
MILEYLPARIGLARRVVTSCRGVCRIHRDRSGQQQHGWISHSAAPAGTVRGREKAHGVGSDLVASAMRAFHGHGAAWRGSATIDLPGRGRPRFRRTFDSMDIQQEMLWNVPGVGPVPAKFLPGSF